MHVSTYVGHGSSGYGHVRTYASHGIFSISQSESHSQLQRGCYLEKEWEGQKNGSQKCLKDTDCDFRKEKVSFWSAGLVCFKAQWWLITVLKCVCVWLASIQMQHRIHSFQFLEVICIEVFLTSSTWEHRIKVEIIGILETEVWITDQGHHFLTLALDSAFNSVEILMSLVLDGRQQQTFPLTRDCKRTQTKVLRT